MLMKKLLLIVATLAMWSAAMAQGGMVTVAKGNESKNIEAEALQNSWYIGRFDERDCWLIREDDGPKTFVRKDDWQVVSVDLHLRDYGRLELPQTGDCKIVASAIDGAFAHVILVDSSNARKTVVLAATVDMDSLQLVGGALDTLYQCTMEKGDHTYVWGAVSADGEYMGLLTLQQFTEKRKYEAEATMFDREMNELWRKEFPVGTTSRMAVSNDGEMLTLGYEQNGIEVKFTMNVITGETGDSYVLKMNCERVEDMQIVNIMDRKMICAGLFAPIKSDPEDNLIGGTLSMAFDIDSATITKFVLRPFQNEDVNILLNKKTKKVQRDSEVPFVTPLASVAMPYGSVMACGHRYVLRYTNANGTVSTTYFAQGIHLLAMDADGEVRWTRNLRRNDFEKKENDGLYIALFAQGDTLCLLKSEHPKEPAEYDIAKESKDLELGDDKCNLVLYRVAENGDVTKTVLEKKTKHMLVAASKREDGSVMMMTRNGKKSRLVELKLE